MKKIILLTIGFLAFYTAQCSHIIGGEIFYDCAGNNVYHITLKLYRDCNCVACAPYENPEYVSVFDGAGNLFSQVAMPLPPFDTISTGWRTPCFTPPGVCVEEADYVADVTLPANATGYTIVYQRCCRSIVVQNLVADQGATFTVEVPPSTLASCNNSARFDTLPPMFVCLNNPLSIDYSATDPDGDSLVYSLCDPFSGASATCPDPSPNADSVGGGCPTVPNVPPYTLCLYNSPYSAANFTNTPSNAGNLTINPHTGLLTGTPNTAGLFDITVCVGEYRNGQLLNTLRRDYQFSVVACVNAPLYPANAGIDTSICTGDTVILGSPAISGVTYQWQNNQGFISSSDTSQPHVVPSGTTTYYSLMTDTIAALNGCGNIKTDSVTIYVEHCFTGIKDKSNDAVNIKLYPNPVKNYANLAYSIQAYQQAKLEIFDQLGQLVIEQTLPAIADVKTISTNQLPNGVYIYHVTVQNEVVKRDKFVIVK